MYGSFYPKYLHICSIQSFAPKSEVICDLSRQSSNHEEGARARFRSDGITDRLHCGTDGTRGHMAEKLCPDASLRAIKVWQGAK